MLAAPVAEIRDVAVRARIGESRANLYDEITDKIIASDLQPPSASGHGFVSCGAAAHASQFIRDCRLMRIRLCGHHRSARSARRFSPSERLFRPQKCNPLLEFVLRKMPPILRSRGEIAADRSQRSRLRTAEASLGATKRCISGAVIDRPLNEKMKNSLNS
jgi:hypothetical protein